MAELAGTTAYRRYGSPTASTVVLVHGLGLCQDVWAAQLPALCENYQVITYDLHGHGESAPIQAKPSLKQFARQLKTLLETCGINRATIVGFSLGGMIARRFAQDYPEMTTALCILHSPHLRSDAAQKAIELRVTQAEQQGAAATVDAALARWFTPAFQKARPDLMAQVRAWVLANKIEEYHRNYKVLARGVSEIVRPDPPLRLPTLVITGDEDDGNGPEMTKAIATDIQGAEIVILKGLRHMALMEAPEQTSKPLLAFLKRHIWGTA